MINIPVTIKGVNETIDKLNGLKNHIRDKAMLSAINKTATQTRNYAVKKIRGQYVITSSDLKDRITIKRATKNTLVAQVISIKKGGALLITKFSARMTKKGLSVKVKRQGKRTIIKDAFISPQGRPLRRTGEKNYVPKQGYWAGKRIKRGPRQGQPILRQQLKGVYGPSIADIFGSTEIYNDLVAFTEKKLVEVFMNELRFYTQKHFNRG